VLFGSKIVSGGNIRELNIDEQFSETRVEKEHQRQQASPLSAVNHFFVLFIYFLLATQVYFVIKLGQAIE